MCEFFRFTVHVKHLKKATSTFASNWKSISVAPKSTSSLISDEWLSIIILYNNGLRMIKCIRLSVLQKKVACSAESKCREICK